MNNMDEAIFEFAYRMALDDATRQQAYKSRGKDSKKRLRECEKAEQAVKKYIEAIFDSGDHPNFKKKVEKTIAEVENAFNNFLTEKDDGEFAFGNAQKLVNMTAKYMFMATYARPELRERFSSCHCPMDSIMVDKAIKQAKPIEKELKEKLELKRGWISALREPWSKITKETRDQYDLFQDLVHNLCSREDPPINPIEFDFMYWQ